MEIVYLPAGKAAGEDSDCIMIQETPEGSYTLAGSVLSRDPDADESTSVAMASSDIYPTFEDAEAAGLAWADLQRSELVHVVRSRGDEPLPDIFDSTNRPQGRLG